MQLDGSSENNWDENRRIALHHYNKAISRLTATTRQESLEVILVSCLLFVCIELLLENVKDAIAHAYNGVNILRAWKTTDKASSPKTRVLEETIEPIFNRPGFQLYNFGWASTPPLSIPLICFPKKV